MVSEVEKSILDAPAFQTRLEGALWWYQFGYRVIPLGPNQKWPALPHYPWLDDLNLEAIKSYWAEYPDHQVGAILTPNQVILDADTPEAEQALSALEARFNVRPALIIKTRRGYHHHFRLVEGTTVKSDSHSTTEFLSRIDVRAGNNSAVLTPALHKSIARLEVAHWKDMTPVGQDFIDAVFEHNGRPAPRLSVPRLDERPTESPVDLSRLKGLLDGIDADCGYDDWLSILMAIYHETAGSPEGLELATKWSARGSTYKGAADVNAKWASFRLDVPDPVTIATIIARARQEGVDVADVLTERFAPCETTVVQPLAEPSVGSTSGKASPFQRYSLIGQAAKFEELAQAAKPLLGDVCLFGEATIWYARPNTGKTLLTLHLTAEAVDQARINPGDIFYINADDSSSGLAEKLALLDELGVHTLVPGLQGFKAEDLESLLLKAASTRTARGTLVIVDTVKKFVDLMNKRQTSQFTNACRQFVSAGGALVGLAHTNKRRGDDGKPIHAGTSDMLDDFDAGYMLDDLSSDPGGDKIVEFTRLKSRGGGVESAAYSYAAEDGLSYAERLASVRSVDANGLATAKRAEEQRSDQEIIASVVSCINAGVVTKMALRNAVAEDAKISRRAAMKVIERYTGDDPKDHRWACARKAHGALTYSLLPDLNEEFANPPSPG